MVALVPMHESRWHQQCGSWVLLGFHWPLAIRFPCCRIQANRINDREKLTMCPSRHSGSTGSRELRHFIIVCCSELAIETGKYGVWCRDLQKLHGEGGQSKHCLVRNHLVPRFLRPIINKMGQLNALIQKNHLVPGYFWLEQALHWWYPLIA